MVHHVTLRLNTGKQSYVLYYLNKSKTAWQNSPKNAWSGTQEIAINIAADLTKRVSTNVGLNGHLHALIQNAFLGGMGNISATSADPKPLE